MYNITISSKFESHFVNICCNTFQTVPNRKIKSKWATAPEKQQSAYAKTKTQISSAVTAQLISAFVFMPPTSEEVEGAYWFGSVRAVSE